LAGSNQLLDTTNTDNDSEMKKEAEDRKLQRLAKVHNLFEMLQGSQNLPATQKESRAQNEEMTAVRFILDTEEIGEAPWSLFQHDDTAAFRSAKRPSLLPTLSANDLPAGRTQMLNVSRIQTINHHPVESDKDSPPESILDIEDRLNWDEDFENPNDGEDDFAAQVESDMETDNCIGDSECPEQPDVSATQNDPGLIRPTYRSKRLA